MNYTDEELIAMWNARNARVNKRNARKASSTEHDLQVACVNEFRYLNPRFADLLIAIPNGGKRNEIVAAKMKAEGVVAGVPDLFFAHPSGEWHGLFLEMKNGKAGVVSEHQKRMMTMLTQHGYKCVICRTRDDFFAALKEYAPDAIRC